MGEGGVTRPGPSYPARSHTRPSRVMRPGSVAQLGGARSRTRARETSVGLRDRRQERRDDRRGGGATPFRLRQKLVSIGDDYWIEDAQGERVYKINGKAMRVRDTLILEDPDGHELLKIQEKKLRVRDTMEIEDSGGDTVATVKKALITPLRERFDVTVENGDDLEVKGNIVDHEYKIERDGDKVAEVSKKWFRVADTYGFEIDPGQDPVLILAVTAVVDSMTHQGD